MQIKRAFVIFPVALFCFQLRGLRLQLCVQRDRPRDDQLQPQPTPASSPKGGSPRLAPRAFPNFPNFRSGAPASGHDDSKESSMLKDIRSVSKGTIRSSSSSSVDEVTASLEPLSQQMMMSAGALPSEDRDRQNDQEEQSKSHSSH